MASTEHGQERVGQGAEHQLCEAVAGGVPLPHRERLQRAGAAQPGQEPLHRGLTCGESRGWREGRSLPEGGKSAFPRTQLRLGTCTRGGGTPTRKRGGARVTARPLTDLATSNPAHEPPGPSLASVWNLDSGSSCVTSAVESELLWLPEAGGFLYWSASGVPLFTTPCVPIPRDPERLT